ncbi:DUF2213 domain-containing protein [Marinobacter alexandrii]|uniref:DUF2213 domain-containing protein n=1 Tax=Marinobacter alexandrii TaxID=2570351 RepID=UPI001107F008|nr:DUF2213 domain-containing protein [Marinobacter alexandrii]
MKFTDSTELSGVNITRDGYLAGSVRCARTGIQVYAGSEVGKPDMETVSVYRGEDQVFAKDSMASFVGKPVTINHPPVPVDAGNWKDYAAGQLGEEVARDGESIRVSLALMDASAIKQVQDGKRELSVGYRANLVWGDGVAPDGTPYQARQEGIIVDHLAVVDAARAGKEFRIGDGANNWGARPTTTQADGRKNQMTDNLRTVVVDGLSVSTTDQGAQAIEKLQNDVKAAQTAVADAKSESTKAVEAKDAEIAKKQAEIDDLKSKVLDDAALDKRVQERADLVGKAKTIAKDLKTTGVSDADIRKAAVVAKLGDEAVKDKPQAYIDARFDILVEDSASNPNDPLRTITSVKPNDGASAWGDSAFKSAGVAMKKEA